MKQFWDIAGLGRVLTGDGPLIVPVEERLKTLSTAERRAFLDWAAEVDQSLRTRAHHEVAALCFGTRATRDFDLQRTWWIMQGPSFVETLLRNPQTAADLDQAEMPADVGETLTRAVTVVAAGLGETLDATDDVPWPSVTTPLTVLSARYPRTASALERRQGPLWSAADLLRHTGRPVESLQDLVHAFRAVADGGPARALGRWGSVEGRIRPAREAIDRLGQPAFIPASLFVYFRPSRAFTAALSGEAETLDVESPETELLAAMVDVKEQQLRVEIPNCMLLRVYRRDGGACQVRSRPAPQLFERANRTAGATDPGAGRRLYAPTPMGAPKRTEAERGVIGKVLNLFGL